MVTVVLLQGPPPYLGSHHKVSQPLLGLQKPDCHPVSPFLSTVPQGHPVFLLSLAPTGKLHSSAEVPPCRPTCCLPAVILAVVCLFPSCTPAWDPGVAATGWRAFLHTGPRGWCWQVAAPLLRAPSSCSHRAGHCGGGRRGGQALPQLPSRLLHPPTHPARDRHPPLPLR